MESKRNGILDIKYISVCILLIVLVVTAAAVVRYRRDDVNYLNSDATWHVLLTMTAYDEIPVSEHRFLPLTNLGGADNKNIPFGSGVAGTNGNRYYTSFSPAGFVMPYLFIKLFHLPINELGLYCYNTFLLAAASVLWFYLLSLIYSDSRNAKIVLPVGVLTFIFSPEVLHGMGIVYWHQSLMQVTLIIQLIAYYKYKTENSKKALVLFGVMTLLNPYIEWTGYVANAGFALAELIWNWKKDIKKAWRNAVLIGVITICSFGLFTVHYLSVVDPLVFFTALKDRFFSRNFTSKVSIISLLKGYVKSFMFIWVLFVILLVWNLLQSRRLVFRSWLLIFVMAFPIAENLVMEGHAVSYPYDRMKMIFVLSFVICEFADQILNECRSVRNTVPVIYCFLIVCCAVNMIYYCNNRKQTWEAPYRQDNLAAASYIQENYPDNVIVTDRIVRGYMILLFHQGLFETTDLEGGIQIAEEKDKRYVVELATYPDQGVYWNMYQITGARIYDRVTQTYEDISTAQMRSR